MRLRCCGWVVADKPHGQLGALVANIGDRDDLPESSARDRTDGEQTSRWMTVPIHDRAIRPDIDSYMQRIDSRQPLVEQAPHGRIGGGVGIFDYSRAIDDRADLHVRYVAVPPSTVANKRPCDILLDTDHFCCYQGQAPGGERLCNTRLNFRRHAVTVHVPPGAHVFEEAALGSDRKLTPEPLGERSNGIDYTSPVAAVNDMRMDAITKPAQQPAGAGPEGNIGLPRCAAHRRDGALSIEGHVAT